MNEPRIIQGDHSAEGKRFAIVVSRFNEAITEGLLSGALETLHRQGADPEQIIVAKVPGAFEIPLIAKKLALSTRYDAVICLGAVIRGDTPHFEYICREVSRGISAVGMETGIPAVFGVITTDTVRQAEQRAGFARGLKRGFHVDENHRGAQAALAAIELVSLIKGLEK